MALKRAMKNGKTIPPLRPFIRASTDLEKVLKLLMLLSGEPSTRTEQVITQTSREIEEQLKADPRCRELVMELYERRRLVATGQIALSPRGDGTNHRERGKRQEEADE
jgi:hypothetical protein